jgi:hypothetical protein
VARSLRSAPGMRLWSFWLRLVRNFSSRISAAISPACVLAIAALSLTSHPHLAAAKAPPPNRHSQEVAASCEVNSNEITEQLKTLSWLRTQEIGEDSAIRQTVLEGKKSNAMATVNINLGQMNAHHCKPYPLPIRDDIYSGVAAYCALSQDAAQQHANVLNSKARLQAQIANVPAPNDIRPELVPECDRATWKPEPKVPSAQR